MNEKTEGEAAATLAGADAVKVFINYRHEDTTPWTARALYNELIAPFGRENVFLDVGTLRPGMNWLDEIRSRSSGAGVFVALIGARWIPMLRQRRRLGPGHEDYVVREIESALRMHSGVHVIPVLVDDAV